MVNQAALRVEKQILRLRSGLGSRRVPSPIRERRREAGQMLYQFLGVGGGDVIELAAEDRVDGGAVAAGKVAEHLPLIERDAGAQHHEPQRLGQDGSGVMTGRSRQSIRSLK